MTKRINSRQKGKTGELELSKELNRLFGLECRRGQQFSGSNGDADCVGFPGLHIECKRVENLNLYTAIDQAVGDAREGSVPVVFHRKNRKQWLVTVELDRLEEVSKRIVEVIEQGRRELP